MIPEKGARIALTEWFAEEGLVSDSAPVVAIGARRSNRKSTSTMTIFPRTLGKRAAALRDTQALLDRTAHAKSRSVYDAHGSTVNSASACGLLTRLPSS